MAKKVALGKGIASLIKPAPDQLLSKNLINELTAGSNEQEAGAAIPPLHMAGVLTVDVSQIHTNPAQPRKIFKEKALKELSSSIAESGIIQPLIVTKADKGFDLIAGERRLKAAKSIGMEKVPVIVKRATDREKVVMSIIENVQRTDLNCVEEALAYYQLMDDFQITQEEVAKRLGKERSTVANYLRILKLPRAVIEQLQKELLSFGHAKVLASVSDRERAVRLANQAVANQLSVRELEKLAKKRPRKECEGNEYQEDLLHEKYDQLRDNLEKKTGHHFAIKALKGGKGEIRLKFSNEAEFNDIYEFLVSKKH
jgi:ParB family transcriptional regulator, chromosome partitioning protein